MTVRKHPWMAAAGLSALLLAVCVPATSAQSGGGFAPTYHGWPGTGPVGPAYKYKQAGGPFGTFKLFGERHTRDAQGDYDRFVKQYQIATAQHVAQVNRLNWRPYYAYHNLDPATGAPLARCNGNYGQGFGQAARDRDWLALFGGRIDFTVNCPPKRDGVCSKPLPLPNLDGGLPGLFGGGRDGAGIGCNGGAGGCGKGSCGKCGRGLGGGAGGLVDGVRDLVAGGLRGDGSEGADCPADFDPQPTLFSKLFCGANIRLGGRQRPDRDFAGPPPGFNAYGLSGYYSAYPGMSREDALRYVEGFQYFPPNQLIRSPRDFFMFHEKYGLPR